jgi:PKD repeat protein
MKYFFPIFVSFILLSSFALILIPNEVKASESEYLNVDFEDGSTGPFITNSGGSFLVESDSTGNYYLKDSKTGAGLNSLYAKLDSWTPESYELSFDFKIDSVANVYYIFGISNSTSTPKKPTEYTNLILQVYPNGTLYCDVMPTPFNVLDNKWHNIFVNVTYGCHARISLDGSTPWSGYYVYSSEYRHVLYPMFGAFASTTNANCYWDNITMVSRIGSLPIASFGHAPGSGDGLTNFVFSDTSSIDNPLFPVSYYWSFGDGNYSRDQNCNHTYIHEGIYEVSLTVGNRFGSDTAYSSITVSAIPSGGGGGTSPWLYTLFPGFIILIMVIIVMRIVFNERMER